jgi:DNA-binding PadR family transcriptional regulator
MDIMEKIRIMTDGRVSVGPGTLYNLLESFVKAGMICETKVEGRRRSYLITDLGVMALKSEYERLATLTTDYKQYMMDGGGEL